MGLEAGLRPGLAGVEGGWGENIFSKDRNFLPWVQFNPP